MKQVSQRLLVILPLATIGCFAPLTAAKAQQIIPDNTLGSESSIVTPDNIRGIPSDRIDGGAVRDTNLFHSFQQFNIDQGRGAYFNPASNIQNILTRVTGNNPSNILGTLGVLTNANLFLINPNGIIFGQNARLDISGSFVGSTASGILFNNGFEFSATNPEAPPLLTVNIPNGLRFRDNPQPLQVQGNGQGIRTGIDLIDTDFGLRVGETQTLALVGGNLLLEGATLKTAGGRIELGSVAGDGIVSITPISKGFTLGYDGVQNLGNIELSQTAAVDASGLSGGDIQAVGRRVTVSGGSQIEASTIGPGTGGSLFVNARELVELSGGFSGLFAIVYPDITGAGGNLTVNASQLLVRDGAQVSVSTFGEGNGGDLTVTATDRVELIGSGSSLSAQQSTVGARGNSGDLTINTQQLLLRDGAFISAGTFGAGNSGNLNVTATDRVELIGSGSSVSVQQSTVGARGNSGDLTINTQQLLLRDGAQILASTFGSGTGGNLTVTATDSVELINGTNPNSQFPTGLFAQQGTQGATGNAGNLTINAPQLIVRDGAQISTGTFGGGEGGNLVVKANTVELIGRSTDGQFPSGLFASATPNSTGNAGDLTINTQQLLVQDGADVNASTSGAGNGGNLTVTADSVRLIGSSSELRVAANRGSTGNAGDLTINTQQLLLRDGAQILANTFGSGTGGNLTVTATDSVELINGTNPNSQFPTGLFAQQGTQGATGNAGNLTINAPQLIVRDGAQISASTFGAGNGGNLNVTASDRVELSSDGSGIFAQATARATGNAGNLTINTRELRVRDEAGVFVQSLGTGTAGNLTVNARSIRLDNEAILTADTRSISTDPNIQQGNITLTARDFVFLNRGSRITANALGNATGGNITITTSNLVGAGNSDITANAVAGRGGQITIRTEGLFGFVVRNRSDLQRLLPSGNFDLRLLPTSDISAISQEQADLSSRVSIDTSNVDPSQDLVDLPDNVIDPSQQIAQNPCQQGTGSEFLITGRGGFPSNPNQTLSSNNIRVDLVEPVPSTSNSVSKTKPLPSNNATAKRIVPAQGWVFNDKGQVVLTAYDPTSSGTQRSWQSASCAAPQSVLRK